MSTLISWRYLTVGKFLEACNWTGQNQASASANRSKPSGLQKPWPRQSVQTFFSQLNWLGHPIEIPVSQSTSKGFSARLTVNDFFQFFVWEGQPPIAVIPAQDSLSPHAEGDELNLNDFSELF